jgi:hypothetical protein
VFRRNLSLVNPHAVLKLVLAAFQRDFRAFSCLSALTGRIPAYTVDKRQPKIVAMRVRLYAAKVKNVAESPM